MPFLHKLPDVGMNYTFNRPLLDGTSPARLKELSAIAPRIKDQGRLKMVIVAAAFVFGLAALAIGTPADAKGFNNAKYVACYNRYAPRHGYSPGWVFIPDYCYEGRLGY
jgi:hypothetical protein